MQSLIVNLPTLEAIDCHHSTHEHCVSLEITIGGVANDAVVF
jgi:hypothetical protein